MARMTRMTRQQRYLSDALGAVQAIAAATEEASPRRRIYGGLCHAFPVLVLTNGLCQTMAFIEAKAAGPPGPQRDAYRDLKHNVIAVLGSGPDPLDVVRQAPLRDYMRHTRMVLEAWVYYKRFAVSELGVGAGDDEDRQP